MNSVVIHQLGATAKTWLTQLIERGVVSKDAVDDFLEPKLRGLSNPSQMLGREAAAGLIAEAIRKKTMIVVFGDYDCDGMTSTALLVRCIRDLGGTAEPELASRFDGGYGLSDAALGRVMKHKPSLLVTCDCGTSDHPRLKALREFGVKTVVIDHHLVPEEELPADAFLNPHQEACPFPFKGMASVGLAFLVAAAVRTELKMDYDVRPFLDLVAVGTIADVAPLAGDNRILVRAGLERLRVAPSPGLAALSELLKIDCDHALSATDVSFRIAPRLNAPGRLGSPMPALELLLASDDAAGRRAAKILDDASTERRRIQDEILRACLQQIEEESFQDDPALILGGEGWNHGIVGIVAGRIAERFAKPTIVIGFERGVGVGSARCPAGFPVYDMITAGAEFLVRYGGHQAAAGLQMNWSELSAFRQRMNESAPGLRASMVPVESSIVIEVMPGEKMIDVIEQFEVFEPCGEGNPLPRFKFCGELIDTRQLRGGHASGSLRLADGQEVRMFLPELGPTIQGLKGKVEVLGELRRDSYRGGNAVQIQVAQIQSC